jgi:prepilin-type N-terminal cleavage/methylation domain-containing protein/prepilin-type processing-associated H-X9-DG protein
MKRPAFTLIELLVVIATIALLMAILLPSLRSSRQQAEVVLCSSNIKQLLCGLFSYETENQTLPYGFCVELDVNNNPIEPPGGYPGNIACDRTGWWWFNFIEGFYKESDNKRTPVKCPSKRLTKPELKNDVLCGNYGVNQSICRSPQCRPGRDEFKGTPLRSSDIRPPRTLLIVDSGYAIISWWHAADKPPVDLGNTIIEDTAYIPGLWINKDRKLWPGQERDAIYGRHPNKTVNVGFVDSHVSRTKADDLFVEKTGDDYRNKSPLWVPK